MATTAQPTRTQVVVTKIDEDRAEAVKEDQREKEVVAVVVDQRVAVVVVVVVVERVGEAEGVLRLHLPLHLRLRSEGRTRGTGPSLHLPLLPHQNQERMEEVPYVGTMVEALNDLTNLIYSHFYHLLCKFLFDNKKRRKIPSYFPFRLLSNLLRAA